jgi:pimeloyl-ACP methyl ester carboxylesterase
VERLVLVDATGYAPPAGFDYKSLYGLNPSTREGMKQLVTKVFFNKSFTADPMINLFLSQRMNAGDGYTINSLIESVGRNEDFLDRQQVQQIKTPTLIVWGLSRIFRTRSSLFSIAAGTSRKWKKPVSSMRRCWSF